MADKPTSIQPPQQTLPLPPEIRDRIYKLILRPEKWFGMGEPENRCLSLLLVSKQIYREAYHIFYQCNNLKFLNVRYLWLFLKNIGYSRRFCVTHISFVWMGPEAKEAFELLKRCPNLKYVDMIMPCRYGHPSECERRYGEAALYQVRGLERINILGLEDHIKHLSQEDNFTFPPRPRYSDVKKEQERFRRDMETLRSKTMRPRLPRFSLRTDEESYLIRSKNGHILGAEVRLLKDDLLRVGIEPVQNHTDLPEPSILS